MRINRDKLCDFINSVDGVVDEIDKIMTEKESPERGKKIAKLMNTLNYQSHLMKRYALGMKIEDLHKKAV